MEWLYVGLAGLILRTILDCTGGDIYGERGARAYNGGLGGDRVSFNITYMQNRRNGSVIVIRR